MFDQICGQVFDQVSGQGFDQGFDQVLGREKHHKNSVQYYLFKKYSVQCYSYYTALFLKQKFFSPPLWASRQFFERAFQCLCESWAQKSKKNTAGNSLANFPGAIFDI